MTIVATGDDVHFEETRQVIVYDNRHMLLVQTSSSTYRPSDTMEIRVVATNENLLPIESGFLNIEIYDAALKLVGEFPRVPIRSGLTETVRYPISDRVTVGSWLVSAVLENTTSSVQVLVSRPITPSFNLKALFPRYLLRSDKMLRGAIEMSNDIDQPIFGRVNISIGQITEQSLEKPMPINDASRQWKSQQMDIAGRIDLNYDLLSMFDVDISKALAVQVYIQGIELVSGQERVIRHVIPIFNREVVYDIRPLEFQAGSTNEFEVLARRPDGKPIALENLIVNFRMIIGENHEEKSVEIKDFFTRGRNDIAFFDVDIPENCVGIMVTMTPVDHAGEVLGYRTQAVPLMPTPRRRGEKLTIELLSSKIAPANTNVNVPVVSSQISTVGRVSNFYVQLFPSKSMEILEEIPLSYMIMTNGRMTLTGQLTIQPTKECHQRTVREIKPEQPKTPTCIYTGSLPIEITRDMIPYSTLVVYGFNVSAGYHVVESYRFSVAGLFQNTLTLNATMVPYSPSEIVEHHFEHLKFLRTKPIQIPAEAQPKSRIELSIAGTPEATVGLNIFEYDGVLQGLTNEITKERLLKYLTTYEQVAMGHLQAKSSMEQNSFDKRENEDEEGEGEGEGEGEAEGDAEVNQQRRVISEKDEADLIAREKIGYQARFPVEKMIFGVSTTHQLLPVEGDDVYTTSNLGRLYDPSVSTLPPQGRKYQKIADQYEIISNNNDYIVATGVPLMFSMNSSMPMESNRTLAWFKQMNKNMEKFSQEALTLVQSGLTIVTDFESLNLPAEISQNNFADFFIKSSPLSTFSLRDQSRQILESYISQIDAALLPPPIVFDEQIRTGYYQSIYFNQTTLNSQGDAKVLLPQAQPYSSWIATGFSLHSKSGLSIAQPVRLPENQGVYILANLPKHMRVNEHALLSVGVNNYFEKDLGKVMIRIRSSKDFELFNQTTPIEIKDKDFTFEIPSMKSFEVLTKELIVVPKRSGLIQMILEVESEFGGDYEIVNFFVRDNGFVQFDVDSHLYDLTGEKRSYGPIVEKIDSKSNVKSVCLTVSGTGLDRLVQPYTMEINSLVGIDQALANLYRSLAFRRYLNESSQTHTLLYNMTTENITRAFQSLQLYRDYEGSYSFVSDEGTTYSSLYLTSLAFGAMLSPYMTVRDNVALNTTLNFILSHQHEDGSFDDESPCYHYRFCSGKFRRESLTAIVLYALTHDNITDSLPEFLAERLMKSAVHAREYLITRVPDVLPDVLTISLFEMAFIQNCSISTELKNKIHQALIKRELVVNDADNTAYLKSFADHATLDAQILVNSMTASLYAYFGDFATSSRLANWIVQQVDNHPMFDTVLDGIFLADAWLRNVRLFRQRFATDKLDAKVHVTADNGEKFEFFVNSSNMDVSQRVSFTLPVSEITYTVEGYGFVGVRILTKIVKEKFEPTEKLPFELTQEFKSMPWFNEIQAKTCMKYTPMTTEHKLIDETLNRTMIVKVELPSGMRVNLQQIGFFLSRVEQMMYFTFDPCSNTLTFFVNVPSNMFGKMICFEWCLERLSTIVNWSMIPIRVYDYIQQETQLVHLEKLQFEPKLLGFSFVQAVHQARPSLEQIFAKKM